MYNKKEHTFQYSALSISQSSGSTSVIALADVGLLSLGNEHLRFLNALSKLMGRTSNAVAGLTIEFEVNELSSCDSDGINSPAAELDPDNNCSDAVP